MRLQRELPALAGICLIAAAACGQGVTMRSGYLEHALVSDGAVMADHVDAVLKNPWGIAFNPQGFGWVADNGTSVATLYDGAGVKQSLQVSIPAGVNGDASPTGIVFNNTSDFVVSHNGKSGTAAFVFDGEGGTLAAWAPAVDLNSAVTVYDDGSGGAVYKGLALAASGGANFLYAADFHNSKIDVFTGSFVKVPAAGGFIDTGLPAGYAPFGIHAIAGKLYVSYAQQKAPGNHDEVDGAGLGYVDVFDTAGHLIKRLVSQGALNAPWGIAMAPGDFGPLSKKLLIGNFGDGKINAYEPNSGQFIDAMEMPDGQPIVIGGLWGIAFGNDLNNQPHNTLFFAAGANDEADGVYGRIDTRTVSSNGM